MVYFLKRQVTTLSLHLAHIKVVTSCRDTRVHARNYPCLEPLLSGIVDFSSRGPTLRTAHVTAPSGCRRFHRALQKLENRLAGISGDGTPTPLARVERLT
jgi:hypothetical protein